MSVPNTNSFTMQDVLNEIEYVLPGAGLQELFAGATPNGFDIAYEGNKDRLLNFRNYDDGVFVKPPLFLIGNDATATSFTLNWTHPSTDHDEYQIYKNGVLFTTVAGTATSAPLTGLDRSTAVSWTMKTVLRGVLSEFSEALVFITLRSPITISVESFATSAICESAVTSMLVYHNGENSYPALGDKLSTTTSGNSGVIDGQDLYRKVITSSTVVKLNHFGTITEIFICP